MENWNKLKQPPMSALKKITGGRLSGKTDINPQWRYQAMTEVYGECGIGWMWELKRMWTEPAPEGQVFAFAEVWVRTNILSETSEWSQPIPGIGGSMLIVKESSGLHANDEAYKMAVTDALSVALKFLGVASDIYMGKFDGSKYMVEPKTNKEADVPESIGEPDKNLIDFQNSSKDEKIRTLQILSAKHKYTPKKEIALMTEKEEMVAFFKYLLTKEK